MSAKHSITVRNLTKKYGDKTVVNGISFDVVKGEVFGIIGPNGAGKTTTLEMLEALREIDGGSVVLEGITVADNPNGVKEIIGVQLQTTGFYDDLTLRELLVLFSGLYHQAAHPDALLADVDLTQKAKAQVKQLSGGQRQRFSIAAALVNNPKVLFLDEPTTGLDPQARRNLWKLVRSIRKKGITVVMTTHYMEEAELLCDRVAIMDEGNIIAIDTPKRLINALLKRGFSKHTEVQAASLEDVFIDLTGKGLRD